MAPFAASSARSSPDPTPMPMSAEPAPVMIERTSAKSRLMSPGVVMSDVIPSTPWNRTWSAIRKASTMGVVGSDTWSSRSFGTTMSVSTAFLSSVMPRSACVARIRPSKPNGRVTTPIVSAPTSRAISATIGAAPVPVPPPSPAVTKTMSAPFKISSISSRCSSAACRPTSGSEPAPRPRVVSRPMSSFTSASDMSRVCASVFTAMNSTPRNPPSIMRLTAFTPPPPIPITLMTAR